jgi:hypothetical protein
LLFADVLACAEARVSDPSFVRVGDAGEVFLGAAVGKEDTLGGKSGLEPAVESGFDFGGRAVVEVNQEGLGW